MAEPDDRPSTLDDSRLAVLASGTGTILSALIGADLPIVVVATDRECPAEEVARRAAIDVVRVQRDSFSSNFDRQGYTDALCDALIEQRIEVVAMAGFGTILSPSFAATFHGTVLNTHPSLLPKHKGWHAVAAALAAGDVETGCTVHLVTAEVDEGPILAQERVPIRPGDTVEVLHERIKEVERWLYPMTVRVFLASNSKPQNSPLSDGVTQGRS